MELQGYIWRVGRHDDLPALAKLDAACTQADGPNAIPTAAYSDLLGAADTATLCATAPDGEIAAVGWVQVGGEQARFGGKVHPSYRRRGLGGHLLGWSETKAQELGGPTTLIIRSEALNEDNAALYARYGYTCDYVEHWMRRDLRQPLPSVPQTFAHAPWTADNARQFFEVYADAFKERPGFPDLSAEEWLSDNTGDKQFRPDLSLLALADGVPVGFVTTGIVPVPQRGETIGFISQVGVHPGWRGRGVAAGLLVAVMAAFQREGLHAADLLVNANNPGAIRVYDQLGFKTMGRRAKYSKPAAPR